MSFDNDLSKKIVSGPYNLVSGGGDPQNTPDRSESVLSLGSSRDKIELKSNAQTLASSGPGSCSKAIASIFYEVRRLW